MEPEHEKAERKSSYIVGGVSLIITLISAIAGVLDYIKENFLIRFGLIALAILFLILIIRIAKGNNGPEEVASSCRLVNRACIAVSIVFIALALIGVFQSFVDSRTSGSIWPIEGCVASQSPTESPIPEITNPEDKIAAGNDFSMLLRNDKKVVTYGKATDIDTTTWENIIQISAYKDHAIGLREDRTVLVTGKDVTEYDVSDWSGIRQVVACNDCVVGVTMDGGIVLAGPNRSCMLDSQNWKSIHRILGAACIVVAERNDGSLIAVDEYEVTEPYMTNLEHRIVSGTAVDNRMLFVLDNGRVKATGKSSVLENIVATWTDMQQVALGNEFAVGLRKNGTVVSIGVPTNEKLDVFGWKDVKAICVAGTHVLGLCQDGTILTGGSESGGLSDIAGENYWVSK